MATSSSTTSDGSCSAPPMDFPLSSELDDVNERLDTNRLKCPICEHGRKAFYCVECVRAGDFVHSISVQTGRFSDMQRRWMNLKTKAGLLEDKCMKALEKHKQRDKMICDINACKERIRLLKDLEKEKKENISLGNQRLSVLKEVNSRIISKLPRQEEQIEKLRKRVIELKVRQEKQKESVKNQRNQLKNVLRVAAKDLIKYIFPLSKIEHNKSTSMNDKESSTTDIVKSALADASRTSYVRGKWVKDSSELYHCIVAPTLPVFGSYAQQYDILNVVSQYKEELPSGADKENAKSNKSNTMWNIVAALTYATQLVNILAFYLNVRLPYKLAYSEFQAVEFSDHKFMRKIARLNSNILHLCFTQNTPLPLLKPRHTLQNLMNLLNTDISDLGRIGPIEVDPTIMEDFQNNLRIDLEIRDSDEEGEEDCSTMGWEAVPNIACPELPVPIPGAMSSQNSSSMQVNQSVAGGLVTSAAASIASIWRGWTTNK